MSNGQYKTRQKEELLAYMRARAGQHLTAREIAEHLQAEGQSIAAATVYRQLERL